MDEAKPMVTDGFDCGMAILTARAMKLSYAENPDQQDELGQLQEELLTINTRDAMYNFAEPAGMVLSPSSERL